jgi:hypothetical protein
VLGFCNFLLKISTPSSLLCCVRILDYPRTLELIIETSGIIDRVHVACFHGYLSRERVNTDKWYAESYLEGRLVGEKHDSIFL